jgi:uncharacterized protein YlxW (UPF0749 family)
MLQHSKILHSRDAWKRKAVQRAEDLREQRKAYKRAGQRIARLEAQIKALERQSKEKKAHLRPQ